MNVNKSPTTEYIYQSLVKRGEEKDDDIVQKRTIDAGDKLEVVFERIPNNAKNKALALLGLLTKVSKSDVQTYYKSMGATKQQAHDRVVNHINSNRSSTIYAKDIEMARHTLLKTTEPDARIEDYAPKSTST